MNLDRNTQRQLINLCAILAAFSTNVLANLKPLAGLTIAEISNQYFESVLILPAGYAFSIWGLIYVGLISLGIYQAFPSQQNNPHTQQLGYWLAFASVAQIIWVILFQYQLFVYSLGLIGLILAFLVKLYITINSESQPLPRKIQWLVQMPISIYCAWITVATIVNAACVLDFLDWQGWELEPRVWTALMLFVGTLLAMVVTSKYQDLVYGGVFIWAWVAISVKHWNEGIVPIVAIVGALNLLVVCAFVLWRPNRLPLSSSRD